jgi:pimeloyl-ACP methyl ester carboxylesterase
MSTYSKPANWMLRERVRVSGGEVAADVFGDGPPVILVHGTPASSYLWRNVVPALANRHSVHVWDLLGFGESRLDPGVAPSIARQARTLAELVEHWGLDSPDLVGHDIGGGTVARAHLIDDVAVRRLALLDAAVIGPWNTPFTEHMQRHEDAYRTMPPHVFADIIAARIRTATHHPMSDAAAGAYLAPWAGPAGQQRWIDQVASVTFQDTNEVVARLGEITAPTIVLWGEEDTWLPPTMGQRLAAAIPGAQRTTIAEAGHFLPEDDPKATADALLQFLTY